MDEFSQFKSKKKTGLVRVNLKDEDGKKIDHWIDMKQPNGKEDRIANVIFRMKLDEVEKLESDLSKDEFLRKKAELAIQNTLIRATQMIESWSFETKCTKESIREVLQDNQWILDQIENQLFFPELVKEEKEAQDFLSKKEGGSKPSRNTNSRSGKKREPQKPAKKNT